MKKKTFEAIEGGGGKGGGGKGGGSCWEPWSLNLVLGLNERPSQGKRVWYNFI